MFCFSCLPLWGCKVDMFDLKVEAVNTHRDRPLVSFWPFFLISILCHKHAVSFLCPDCPVQPEGSESGQTVLTCTIFIHSNKNYTLLFQLSGARSSQQSPGTRCIKLNVGPQQKTHNTSFSPHQTAPYLLLHWTICNAMCWNPDRVGGTT